MCVCVCVYVYIYIHIYEYLPKVISYSVSIVKRKLDQINI